MTMGSAMLSLCRVKIKNSKNLLSPNTICLTWLVNYKDKWHKLFNKLIELDWEWIETDNLLTRFLLIKLVNTIITHLFYLSLIF